MEASNPPYDISKYELQDREVKFFCPRYNKDTSEFLGLYETVGLLVARGDAEEIFLNYGYGKEKSKVLYSNYDSGKSFLYFFLPSVTDRSETVNQYLNNICISPLDIKQEQLSVWGGNVMFNPQKLDYQEVDSKVMRDAVVKCLEHIAAVSI